MSADNASSAARLLIVNPFHPQLAYIPMGSLGLCDYLAARGVDARIFNAALYERREHVAALERAIHRLQPTHVGIVIHWKELLESALHLAFAIKARHPAITIIAGGLSAAFFADELLERYRQIDFVVAGDPERPLELLLGGAPAAVVPNLRQRDARAGDSAPAWAITKAELDAICFSDVRYLLDAERYVARISSEGFPAPLGFPLMIGRGCAHDCPYCGGSKRAFRQHSGRRAVVLRSVDAVLGDLRRLLGVTDRIYICHETSAAYARRLLQAIASADDLARRFVCSYGSYGLMRRDVIELYARAFRSDARQRAVIEISPETTIEADRPNVRDRAVAFSDDELRGCLGAIRDVLGDTVETHLFYSRYHQTHDDVTKLDAELDNLHRLHAWLYESGWDRDVRLLYLDLSTDPGSALWDRLRERVPHGDGLELLLAAIKASKLPAAAPPTRDNLCLYLPPAVDEAFAERYGALVVALRLLEHNAPLYYYNITRALGFAALRQQLAAIVDADPSRVLFTPRGCIELLARLHRRLVDAHPELYARRPAFFDGLAALCSRALAARVFGAAAADGVLEAQPVEGELPVYNARPRLDERRVYVTDYDYGSQQLYRSIDRSLDGLVERPTLYLLCADGVHCFDAERTLPLLRTLDGERSLADVARAVATAPALSADERSQLRALVVTKHYQITR